jgi:tetratricopeptide (TPR) repeat protein
MSVVAKRTLILALIAAVVAGWLTTRAMHIQSQKDNLAQKCAAAFEAKHWQTLETASREWLKLESAPAAWFWLGTALKGQARYLDADLAFQQVPANGIRGIDAAIEHMEIQFHVAERPLNALPLALRLLERDERLASPRRHLIYFYAMTLQRPQFLREFRQALQFRVDLPEHYVYLLALEDLAFRDAETVTAKWAQANPESQFLQTVHAVQLVRSARNEARQTPSPERRERYDRIRDAFVAAHHEDSPSLMVLDTLLLLAVDRGDLAEVARLLELVPDEATDDPVFWKYRGWYAAHVDDAVQAEDSFRQALALHPLAWQTRHELANLLRRLGRADEAAKLHTIASQGTELIGESRRLPHAQKVSNDWLARLAKYAEDCGDYQVVNGIVRRRNFPVQ